jgi:hypothetical protein
MSLFANREGAGCGYLSAGLRDWLSGFGPQPSDHMPEPKAILEELADEVMGQMDRVAIVGFNDTLRAMLDYHKFVLNASATTDEFGQARSLSEVVGGSRPSSWWKFDGDLRWPWVRPPGVEVGAARHQRPVV